MNQYLSDFMHHSLYSYFFFFGVGKDILNWKQSLHIVTSAWTQLHDASFTKALGLIGMM